MKLVVNVDRGQWSHLGHGTTALLYSRGVHQYTGAFDHAMLESQLSIIVCIIYTIRLFSRRTRSLLTPISSGTVWPILEV